MDSLMMPVTGSTVILCSLYGALPLLVLQGPSLVILRPVWRCGDRYFGGASSRAL